MMVGCPHDMPNTTTKLPAEISAKLPDCWQDRFQVIEDREVLHPAQFECGPRIGRFQRILDTVTQVEVTVNFWFQNGRLIKVA